MVKSGSKVAWWLALLVLGACSGADRSGSEGTEHPRQAARETPERSEPRHAEPRHEVELPPIRPRQPSTYAAPTRLIAIGDVHGDLDALRRALRLAGAIDEDDHWSGGELFVVQTGDVLDRGDDEDEILAMALRLETEAAAAGGHFVTLIGNHELMNVQGDFRYVTPEGYDDFHRFGPGHRGRRVAFEPGGYYARELAARNVAVLVGDTLLVHGGLTAESLVGGLDAIDDEARAFLLGQGPLSARLSSEESPVWYRGFAGEMDDAACAALASALERAGAARMVVGHTVQESGITSACDGRVWRIDVGLARYYRGPTEVLEVTSAGVRVLR
jgi:hypothetical protein